ncbi:MAG TPA: hypothetical protein VIM93_02650 [Kangiella sp.]
MSYKVSIFAALIMDVFFSTSSFAKSKDAFEISTEEQYIQGHQVGLEYRIQFKREDEVALCGLAYNDGESSLTFVLVGESSFKLDIPYSSSGNLEYRTLCHLYNIDTFDFTERTVRDMTEDRLAVQTELGNRTNTLIIEELVWLPHSRWLDVNPGMTYSEYVQTSNDKLERSGVRFLINNASEDQIRLCGAFSQSMNKAVPFIVLPESVTTIDLFDDHDPSRYKPTLGECRNLEIVADSK